MINVVRAKKSERIPVVFSREEVSRIISKMSGTKKLMVKLLYGTGLRLHELLSLRILDLDFDRREITVRNGKGSKDRTGEKTSSGSGFFPRKLAGKIKTTMREDGIWMIAFCREP